MKPHRPALRVAIIEGIVLVIAIGLFGCGSATTKLSVSDPDRAVFEMMVYPVLLRDCSFHICHGSSKRFFQVFGPGRDRLLATTQALDAATPEEIDFAYQRARSMIDVAAPAQSLLLRKPLSVSAGGTGHEGSDRLGRNVYESKLEAGYMTLEQWVLGAPPVAAP